MNKSNIKYKRFDNFRHSTYENLKIKSITLGKFDKKRILNLLDAARIYSSYKDKDDNTVIQTEYIKYIILN